MHNYPPRRRDLLEQRVWGTRGRATWAGDYLPAEDHLHVWGGTALPLGGGKGVCGFGGVREGTKRGACCLGTPVFCRVPGGSGCRGGGLKVANAWQALYYAPDRFWRDPSSSPLLLSEAGDETSVWCQRKLAPNAGQLTRERTAVRGQSSSLTSEFPGNESQVPAFQYLSFSSERIRKEVNKCPLINGLRPQYGHLSQPAVLFMWTEFFTSINPSVKKFFKWSYSIKGSLVYLLLL